MARYEAFTVFNASTKAVAGHVEAQSAEEAVFRLVGGEYGRSDYVARGGNDRPMASPGLTSYRYQRSPRHTPVMIGAGDKAGALAQARLSINEEPDTDKLEIWSADALAYVKA